MFDIVLIADDLTGAADSAAPFATHGHKVRLLLDPQQQPGSGVTAISTESRELDQCGAQEAVRRVCQQVEEPGPNRLLFKKIDSTLRGHIADELEAVVQQFGVRRILLTPAFPSQGRTTQNGRLYVHGIPFACTNFARAGNDGNLVRLFEEVADLPVHHYPIDLVRDSHNQMSARLNETGIHIPDIETDEDLARVARFALDTGINTYCGAGGLGRALARCLSDGSNADIVPEKVHSPALIVAGSLNHATVDQVEAVRKTDTSVVNVSDTTDPLVDEITGALRTGRNLVLTTHGWAVAETGSDKIQHALAKIVRSILTEVHPGVLLLTGGDIAAAVCRELQANAISLQGEFEPGIPTGRLEGGLGDGVMVITKAGGFGDRGTFVRLLASVCR